ncbi:S8 family serine peptidase [Kribbella sp. NPDC059898]|uniref:S8 family serine peptidase n=1 Tax=Kribbella sp. NPDC059898 TaxID=3346995 RepID=UPI003654F855
MHFTARTTNLTGAVTAGCLAVTLLASAGLPPAAAAPSAAARDVIVVFDTPPAAVGADLAEPAGARAAAGKHQQLRQTQDGVLAAARTAGLKLDVHKRFTTVLNAVAATVPASELPTLEHLPGVARVVPDLPVHAMAADSVVATQAATKSSAAANDGAGVTVAVVDTGVDYSHPDLGGGFGEGHKVVGGYDFVNGDADPMDDNGHGTHVAGIIAADGEMTGAAPGAEITAYKALDANGSGSSSDIVAAIDAAVDPAGPHPADVVNLSIGVDGGSGDDPVTAAAQAAADAGVIVVASAGNAGPGASSVASPAVAPGVIAVGATQGNRRVGSARMGTEPLQTFETPLTAGAPAKPVTGTLVDVGYASPEEVGDLHGKVALMNGFAGPTAEYADFMDRAAIQRIQDAGAIAVLIGQPSSGGIGISSVPEPGHLSVDDSLRMKSLVVLGMDDTQYAELAAAAGRDVTILGKDVSGEIAPFSARGPVNDGTFRLKPDVSAPGVDVVSTVPKALDPSGYAAMSGTSMASPAVAGAAAVMRQRYPDKPVAEIRSALIGASDPLPDVPPTTDGAGRMNLASALKSPLETSPTSLSFGLADLDGKSVSASKAITLHNTGTSRLVVHLNAKGVKLQPATVSLAAGESRTVKVTLTADVPTKSTNLEGDLIASFTGGAVTVPYLLAARPMGVYVTLGSVPSLDVVAPLPFQGTPKANLTGPDGKTQPITLQSRGPGWAGAPLTGLVPGLYHVTSTGTTASGVNLIGSTSFEVPGASSTTKWSATGPNSQGGDVTPSPQGDVAVATVSGSTLPWVSTDAGKTWNPRPGAPLSGSLGRGYVTFDRTDSKRFWYAVNECVGGCGTIVRTDDQGATWKPQHLDNAQILGLFTMPDGAVVAVTPTSLLSSTDDGTTWSSHPTGISGDVQYAAVLGGKLYLTDGRKIWSTPMSGGAPGAVTLSYSATTTVFVTSLSAGDGVLAANVWLQGAVASTDGTTWKTVHAGNFHESVQASGTSIYATDNGTGFLSEDRGATWREVQTPNRNGVVTDFDVWAAGDTIANSAGIYRLGTDGFQRIGLSAATVDDLLPVGDRMLAATETGVYSSPVDATGKDWGVGEGEGMVGAGTRYLASSGDVVWRLGRTAFGGSRLDRSDDAGTTWTTLSDTENQPTALWADPDDPAHVIAGFKRPNDGATGIRVTKDGGQTWKNIYTSYYVEAINTDDAGRLLLGGPDGLFRSTDGGATATKVLDGRVSTIRRTGRYLIAAGDAINVSTKDGRWTTAGLGGVPTSIGDVVVTGKAWYAAGADTFWGVPVAGRGVLESTDHGRSWHSIGAGLPTTDARALAVSSDGKWLYAGLGNAGTYRIPIG